MFASKERGGLTPIEFSNRRAAMRVVHGAYSGIDEKFALSKGAVVVPIPRGRGYAAGAMNALQTSAPRRTLRWVFPCMMIVSLAVHGAVMFGIWAPSSEPEQFGTAAEDKAVVSLSTVQTLVLESLQTDSTQTASAAFAASQAGSIQAAESAPQELSEVKDEPISDDPPPKPVKVADVTPTALAQTDDPLPVIRGGGAPDTLTEVKAQKVAEQVVEEMPLEVETKEEEPAKTKRQEITKNEKKKQIEQKESHAQAAGGATSRSSAAQAPSNGRMTASRGNVLSYMASVRARIARHKVSVYGARGKAVVTFALNTAGELKFVRLAKSSENERLDQAALATIRKAAPFLPPPPEIPPTQTYSIPIYAN
jgi:protein TonB